MGRRKCSWLAVKLRDQAVTLPKLVVVTLHKLPGTGGEGVQSPINAEDRAVMLLRPPRPGRAEPLPTSRVSDGPTARQKARQFPAPAFCSPGGTIQVVPPRQTCSRARNRSSPRRLPTRITCHERLRSFPGIAVNQVPLIRYFFFVGSLLLALLFLADGYWADASSPSFAREARVDKSIIRIQSAHKWPEQIAFDTNQPTIVPPPLPLLASVPVANQWQEAFAQLKQPSQQVSRPSAPPKAKRKLARRVPATRVAAYPAAPETWPSGW
jgi:hypothetical protein